MADRIDQKRRSALMARVRSKDTRPEMVVRSIVYRLGFRYRLHQRDIPGSPDLVFRGRKKVIFVHGCFWHGHDCAAGRNVPSSRIDYWQSKLGRNRERDARNEEALRELGWGYLIIWECETKDPESLRTKISCFLLK